MRVKLQHLAGSKKGQLEEITAARITVGRNADNLLAFDPEDQDVSGSHAVLEWNADGFLYVQDVGSRNGTFVNGAPVAGGQPVPAPPGSMVQFGKQGPALKLDYQPQPKQAAAPPAGAAPAPASSGGLSKGAKIGIAVGAVALVGIVILIIVLASGGGDEAKEGEAAAGPADLLEGGAAGAVAAAPEEHPDAGGGGGEGATAEGQEATPEAAAGAAAPAATPEVAGDPLDDPEWFTDPKAPAPAAGPPPAQVAFRAFGGYKAGEPDRAGISLPQHAMARLGPAYIPCESLADGFAWVGDDEVAVVRRMNGERVRRFDVKTGKELGTMPGGLPTRAGAARKVLLIRPASGDGVLVDAASGRALCAFEGKVDHSPYVTPDGARVLAHIRGGGFGLFGGEDGRLLRKLEGSEVAGGNLAGIGGDGRELAYIDDKGIAFVDAESGAEKRRVSGRFRDRWVPEGGYSYADDLSAYAELKGGKAHVTSLRDGKAIRAIDAPDAELCLLSPGAKLLALGTSRRNSSWGPAAGAKIYDVASGKLVSAFVLSDMSSPLDARFSPAGSRIALIDARAGMLRFHDVSTGKEVGGPRRPEKPLTAVAASRDGQWFAVAYEDGEAQCGHTQAREGRARRLGAGPVAALTFHGDGDESLLALSGRTVVRWDWRRKSPEPPVALPAAPAAKAHGAISSDGSRAAFTTKDGGIALFDLGSGDGGGAKLHATLAPSRHKTIRALALSHSGKWLGSAGSQVAFRAYDVAAAKDAVKYEKAADIDGFAVSYSSDGRYFAFAVGDEVHIFPVGEKKKRATVKPARGDPPAIALSGDGGMIAIPGEKGALEVFDVATGQKLVTFPSEGGAAVVALAFSGKHGPLVAGYASGDAIAWSVPEGKPK